MGTPFNERDSTCRVNLIDDSLFEEDEFFFVKLEKASYNARLGKIDTVKVIIDGPNDFPIIQMSETIMHVEENSGKYSYFKNYHIIWSIWQWFLKLRWFLCEISFKNMVLML